MIGEEKNMSRISVIELYKETYKFSVAHFTIFSETERENLHGHNYHVHTSLKFLVTDNGMSFDYRFYKEKIRKLCRSIGHVTLLPTQSQHLKIEDQGDYYCAIFANEKLYFLKRDVVLMPLKNITIEELSRWFLEQLLLDKEQLEKNFIKEITVRVFSDLEQSGSSSWSQ